MSTKREADPVGSAAKRVATVRLDPIEWTVNAIKASQRPPDDINALETLAS